jgi:hypothetical protein
MVSHWSITVYGHKMCVNKLRIWLRNKWLSVCMSHNNPQIQPAPFMASMRGTETMNMYDLCWVCNNRRTSNEFGEDSLT